MAICANKGCGKPFVQDEKCSFHPGAPVFHDALKGWSCCEKKVVDFDAFLKIPGCTTGSHSNVAIQAPVKAPVKETKTDVSVSKPETKPIVVQPKDVQSSQLKVEAKAEVKKDQKPKSDESVKVPEKDLFDDPNAVIEIGTKCKRPSCGHAYTDTSKSEKCTFHNGSPIFHEGSKGWSCCSRKVLEFDEFLKIKGCTEGNHRFTAGQTTSGPVVVDCRRDWYQTPDKVIVSLFAKKVDRVKSKILFEEERLDCQVLFLDGSIHNYKVQLFQPIIPAECSFEILSTKIEIRLKKSNGMSWPAVEANTNVTSWTTFGLQGSTTGTVGSKNAVIAGDAPLHLLQQ